MFLYSLTEPARVLICMISVFCVGFQYFILVEDSLY